ncbi:MAG: DUF2141 domain-containing protein [Cocleimonas sp.]|nr:DUF2141 domain-containing protein [Cocleimonas sp.]
MKLAIIFSTLFSSALVASSLQAANLTVIIDNIDMTRGGTVRIGLYSPKEKFLSDKPLQGQEQKIKSKKVTFVFKNIQAGQYAISSYQDTNDNKQVDSNFLGLPIEPYGVSGKSSWGKPKFKSSSFTLGTENKTITIRYD